MSYVWIPMSRFKRWKPPGKAFQSKPKGTCNWCEFGTLPTSEGICENCVAQCRRQLQSLRWHRLRIAMLHAPCSMFCHVCITEALHVATEDIDHVEAWRFRPDLFWEPDNHRGLCKRHHSLKTLAENGNFHRNDSR